MKQRLLELITATMRAYSKNQLYENGIHTDIYVTAEQEGIFKATLDYKRWGRNRNVLAYFTLEDGRKIMASAWQDTGYLGIPEIPMGATVRLTFQKAKNDLAYLRGVEEEK